MIMLHDHTFLIAVQTLYYYCLLVCTDQTFWEQEQELINERVIQLLDLLGQSKLYSIFIVCGNHYADSIIISYSC